MIEIGSFLEFDLLSSNEYYNGKNVARLNSARSGIYHSMCVLKCSSIYLPFYECYTVRDFLISKGITVKYYSISESFEPLIENVIEDDSAVLIVNYFGVMGQNRMKSLSSRFKNVIIDNAQAFYSKPLKKCLTVYSARKFFGVPDGCYVLGINAGKFIDKYEQDNSASTSNYLFERIEVGCSTAYSSRMKNEERIDKSDILRMSKLTLAILKNEPYSLIKQKRVSNFNYTHELFKELNLINPIMYIDEECVPMIYPLVVDNNSIVKKLNENKIYTGRWWNYLLNETKKDSFENKLSSFLIPIPIDQRYDLKEINYVFSIIKKLLNE